MSKAVRKPNLFLVGAPKCGTTSFYRYLQGHPEVFFPEKKLFQQFCTDLTFDNPRLSIEEYLAHFQNAGDAKYLGDGSTFHLVSKEAAKNIKAFSPEARCVILLRNPCDMLYSLHSELLFTHQETIEDFEEALDAEPERKANPDASFRWKREAVYYSDMGRFSEQVARYLDVFGRERVHIILFDDLKADSEGAYRKLLAFLEIDPSHRIEPATHNPNKVTRSKTLSSLINSPAIRAAARATVPTRLREGIHQRLNQLNKRNEPRAPLPETTRRRIQAMYAGEGDKLSELIGRDVRHWYTD